MENYKDKLNNFSKRIAIANQTPTLQEVRQVEKKAIEEVQLNVWIPKTMLYALKQKSLDKQLSLKEIAQEAFKNYLT